MLKRFLTRWESNARLASDACAAEEKGTADSFDHHESRALADREALDLLRNASAQLERHYLEVYDAGHEVRRALDGLQRVLQLEGRSVRAQEISSDSNDLDAVNVSFEVEPQVRES